MVTEHKQTNKKAKNFCVLLHFFPVMTESKLPVTSSDQWAISNTVLIQLLPKYWNKDGKSKSNQTQIRTIS